VIEFRPLAARDLPLLEEWLLREHVRLWWREPIEHELEHELDGRYAILLDGAAVGMIQTYLVADHPEWGAIVGMEDGLAGDDLLVGEEGLVGRGLGPRVLDHFVREIVFARPGRPPASPPSRRGTDDRGARSRRRASGRSETSRRKAFRTG
jgi:Acetyltransferase (GNAT) domain